jgi:translocator protein
MSERTIRQVSGRRSALGLGAWLIACYGAAALGAQFAPGAWYAELAKPAWTPPAIVFGPVWTVLYAMMAVAAWLVWKAHGFGGARLALGLFGVQLILNAAWSWLFFGRQQPGLAFIDIVLLWVMIVATIIAFRRLRPGAAALLVPYLLWVSFAAALNFAIWRMNQ